MYKCFHCNDSRKKYKKNCYEAQFFNMALCATLTRINKISNFQISQTCFRDKLEKERFKKQQIDKKKYK